VAKQDRVRRPTLERTKPIRNWSTVMSPGPAGAPARPEVQNANRVVEEYLRAGEASARLFQNAVGGTPGNGNPDIAQSMVRAASDMMSFWVELMTRSVGGMATAERTTSAAPQAATGSEAGRDRRLSVAVDSRRPVTVSLDLRPDARGATLRLERLHRRGPGKAAPLAGAEIETSPRDELVTVRLHVASDQPPGVYFGVIVDEESSRPVGNISVELHGARTPAKSRRT